MHAFIFFVTIALLTIAHALAIPIRRGNEGSSNFILQLTVGRPTPTSLSTSTISPTPSGTTMTVVNSSAFPSPTQLSSALPSPSSSQSQSTAPTTSTVSSTGSPIPSSSSQKAVVAHHMVGNTFPYTLQDWTDDITLAHASGIDGFALNVGRDDFQKQQVANAYQAALESGLDFKLFFSLDMSSLPCGSTEDAQALRSWVQTYSSHPNQFVYSGKPFVSTFSGETCTFGQSSVVDGWKSQFVQHPDMAGNIVFVPAFFVDPTTFSTFKDVMSGDFNWNSGWPVELTTDFAKTLSDGVTSTLKTMLSLGGVQSKLTEFIGSTETDEKHLEGLSNLSSGLTARDGDSPVYMASVSPWFFTHYGQDSFNKNFVFLGDQHLYARRWESLIASRDKFDIVEINTWNDYGESHYIGPIKGAQPNSEAWTDGMNHTAWLGLTEYYATAFKTGSFPEIEKDQIYMWSRPHSTIAEAQNDPVGRPTNFELFEDAVWVVVLTTAPSSVTLSTSDTNIRSFDVPAGLSKLSIPISPGDTMGGVISREGKTVIELHPDSFSFQGSPPTYNFNAFVASASAE